MVQEGGAAVTGHDLVVIGGSAGSLVALERILAALPADLPATVLIVTHLPPARPSTIAQTLSRHCALPVEAAADGAMIRPGTVLVASPDRHLLVIDGRVQLGIGPRENLARPAIDPLFRSAAIMAGARTIGVLLSGMLDDGAAGLAAIRRCGGMVVVQDPGDADYDEMPRNAIATGFVDHVVPAAELGSVIVRLTGEPAGVARAVPPDLAIEVDIALGGPSNPDRIAQIGDVVTMTCLNCSGVLSEVKDAQPLRYRCQTGHGYTAKALEALHDNAVDDAFRVALRIMMERTELVTRMQQEAIRAGRAAVAEMYGRRAQEYGEHADTIQQAIVKRFRPQSG
ncbi:MAG TPA: chemotaxis protein CheB [Sphingomonas sp.]|jgi:two-component system chemotaxis response regulator CheB|uniref:chemotaxis protein CheB n=1 Tax=Sphingomonas sp. TaxID=28214 RepID=UPI002EDAC1C1